MKRKTNTNTTKKLVEASVMIAFATVLSMLKLVDMPYGGSVTAASMLPMVIVSYRHGTGMGLASGLVFATIQQLLGLNTLSYVTGWQSVIAVITLDYILAFTLVGLGGIFKEKLNRFISYKPRRQCAELVLGMTLVCILRYVCHTVAGATVWAGLSIPTEAALVYSIGYNATYMIPETIVTALAAGYIGSVIDLSRKTPERFAPLTSEGARRLGACELLPHLASLVAVIVVAIDTVLISPHLQNGITGEFDFSGLSSAPWLTVGIVSAVGIALVSALIITSVFIRRKNEAQITE